MRLRLQWILLLASLIYAAQEQSISTEDGYYHLAPRTGISNNPTYLESSVDTLYKVGPGDFFELMMENQSILVQVSPEGTVGAELIGVVSVVNLPLWEAKKKILAAMVKVYTEKECFVKLAQIRAPMINVYGAVSIPGQVVLRPGGRLSSVLRDLGGLLPKANADSVLLIRDGDTTLLSYLNAESGIDVKGDPLLQGGDVVIVPEFGSSESVIHVYFAGMAGRSIPYHKGWHVGKYIQQSRLMRLNQSAHTHIEIQNSESLKSVVLPINKALTLEPAPDDVLILFSQNASVYVGGAVNHSGPIEYNPTKTPQIHCF